MVTSGRDDNSSKASRLRSVQRIHLYVSLICFLNQLTLFRLDAVGGRDDATELSTAERYNPKTNQWSPVVAMNSRRSGVNIRPSIFSRVNTVLPLV